MDPDDTIRTPGATVGIPVRGLAMSMAGAKGAFQVGALERLLYELETPYDYVAGSSAGGINAAFVAQYNVGDEVAAYVALKQISDSLRNDKVYRHWLPFGPLSIFLEGKSVYNSAPLGKLLRKHVDPERLANSTRCLILTATNYHTGELEVFSELDDVPQAALATSAIPGVFPMVKLGDGLFMDGGVSEPTPITPLIKAGCTHIDVICAYSKGIDLENYDKKPEGVDAITRALDILVNRAVWRDVQMVQMYNRLVEAGAEKHKRPIELRIIAPDSPRDPGLNFGGVPAHQLHHEGYVAALKVTPNGE